MSDSDFVAASHLPARRSRQNVNSFLREP